MRPFDRHDKQPISVWFVQRWNVATITDRCVKLSYAFERFCAAIKYFTYFRKSSVYLILISARCHSYKHDDFLLLWSQNVKEHDTHVSRKSCIIQPIQWRLQNSWSVSTFVCHMHQTFSQTFSLKTYCVYEDTSKYGFVGYKEVRVFNSSRPYKVAKKTQFNITTLYEYSMSNL